MNLCSEDHDEVCFDGRSCPVCSVRDEIEREKDREIDNLKERVLELEAEVEQLANQE